MREARSAERQATSAKRTTCSCIVFSYIPYANPNHLPSVSYNPISVKKFIYTYTHWQWTWDNVRWIINKQKEENMDTAQLKRIADAMEEILRLVKADQEQYKKKSENEEEN